MLLFSTEKSVLQELSASDWKNRNIRVLVKRDDLIDPLVSGNKWRKLKYIIALAVSRKKDGILTLGGAYSNHLLATAAACRAAGLHSVGIVRGEELTSESNENLLRCRDLGMELVFVSRTEYAERNEPERQEIWKQRYPEFLFVPEGGAMYHGLIGCQEIWKEIPEKTDHVFVAQGTTAMSCGLLLGSREAMVHVVPVLKGFDSLQEMQPLLYSFLLDRTAVNEYLQQVRVHDQYHFGGYAVKTPELESFIRQVQEKHALPLDRIYTAKAFFAMTRELEKPEYNGTTVMFLHTGGMMNG